MRRRRRSASVPPEGEIPQISGVSLERPRRQRSRRSLFGWLAGDGGRTLLRTSFWLLLGGGAAYGAYMGLQSFQKRTLNVCLVTDVEYHEEKPDWQAQLKPLFAEVNKAFEASGVQWTYTDAGEAYPSSVT